MLLLSVLLLLSSTSLAESVLCERLTSLWIAYLLLEWRSKGKRVSQRLARWNHECVRVSVTGCLVNLRQKLPWIVHLLGYVVKLLLSLSFRWLPTSRFSFLLLRFLSLSPHLLFVLILIKFLILCLVLLFVVWRLEDVFLNETHRLAKVRNHLWWHLLDWLSRQDLKWMLGLVLLWIERHLVLLKLLMALLLHHLLLLKQELLLHLHLEEKLLLLL